jgi:hypothetical protein
MAPTRRTTCKSTGRLPVGQLAPRNVPQPQESQPDIPQEATPEEEPFEIELVVPKSPTAQDSPAKEQQPEDPGTEDKTNEEQPPSSDTEPEKLYQDADEVESFGAESPILAGRLRALLEHLGITTAPQYRIKKVPLNTDYADFQHMVDKAIVIENKIQEMEKDGKRKVPFSGQSSGSNVRPRFTQPNQFFKPLQMNQLPMPVQVPRSQFLTQRPNFQAQRPSFQT